MAKLIDGGQASVPPFTPDEERRWVEQTLIECDNQTAAALGGGRRDSSSLGRVMIPNGVHASGDGYSLWTIHPDRVLELRGILRDEYSAIFPELFSADEVAPSTAADATAPAIG